MNPCFQVKNVSPWTFSKAYYFQLNELASSPRNNHRSRDQRDRQRVPSQEGSGPSPQLRPSKCLTCLAIKIYNTLWAAFFIKTFKVLEQLVRTAEFLQHSRSLHPWLKMSIVQVEIAWDVNIWFIFKVFYCEFFTIVTDDDDEDDEVVQRDGTLQVCTKNKTNIRCCILFLIFLPRSGQRSCSQTTTRIATAEGPWKTSTTNSWRRWHHATGWKWGSIVEWYPENGFKPGTCKQPRWSSC